MKREIKLTSDGSNTLYINELNESYHSQNGALNEANHVFIKNGMNLINDYEINILELGFGTGLNVLVTFNEFLKNDKNHIIQFFSLEKYPVSEAEISELGYSELFEDKKVKDFYRKIHQTDWEVLTEVYPNFYLKKIKCDFSELINIDLPPINLVFYDCFAAKVQPDLWEKPLFEMVAQKMKIGGLLTTYSSKGSMRRILQELNFKVQKKEGPPGKREMINAILQEK